MIDDFEARSLELLKAKREAGITMTDDNGAPATREALFWKRQDGTYGVLAFNVALQGYKWGYEAAQRERLDANGGAA